MLAGRRAQHGPNGNADCESRQDGCPYVVALCAVHEWGTPAVRLGKTGHDGEKQLGAEVSGEHSDQHAGTENNRDKFERNHLESPLISRGD